MRHILVLFMIVPFLIFGCTSSIVRVEKSKNFQQQLKYQRETKLDVLNPNGSVAIQAQNNAEFATVTATIKAVAVSDTAAQEFLDQIDVRFAKEGDELSVETIYPRAWTMKGKAKRPSSWSVDYTIIIPDGLDVICESSNGEIKVVGENEKVEVQTQNGGILVKENRKEVVAVAVNGDIEIRNEQDYNISVRATTQNGSQIIDMPNAQMGKFAIRTTNGNISMSLPSGYEPEIDLSTTNGNVEIFLGQRLSAQVELRTSKGNVNTDMVVNTTTGVGGILEKKVIKGVVGGGFGNVKAITTNGNITMKYGEAPEPTSGETQQQEENK